MYSMAKWYNLVVVRNQSVRTAKGSFVNGIEYGIRMHSYQIQFYFPYTRIQTYLRMEFTDKRFDETGYS